MLSWCFCVCARIRSKNSPWRDVLVCELDMGVVDCCDVLVLTWGGWCLCEVLGCSLVCVDGESSISETSSLEMLPWWWRFCRLRPFICVGTDWEAMDDFEEDLDILDLLLEWWGAVKWVLFLLYGFWRSGHLYACFVPKEFFIFLD